MSALTQAFDLAAATAGPATGDTALIRAARSGNADIIEEMLRNAASIHDPASGTWRDNQADGFKADPDDVGQVQASPDSQADGYKESEVQTGHSVTTMKPLTFGKGK